MSGTLLGRKWRIAIISAAILSFAAKTVININTYGSTDALLWETNLQELHQGGALALYRNGTILRDMGVAYHFEVFNHPPFIIHLLSWWGALAKSSGLPLRFWVRFTCAVADLASIFLLLAIVLSRRIPVHAASLMLIAASPVSLMISGFHGNVDPIMLAFLLLSLYLLEVDSVWLAGAALGTAVNIKIVPLLFAPAMFLSLPRRKGVTFVLGAAVMLAIGSVPFLFEDPLLIATNVFGYSPQSGMWGLSSLILALWSKSAFRVFALVSRPVLLLSLGVLSLWMNSWTRKPALFAQCGFLAFFVLAASPGFGVQYLVWLVPWTCLLRFREALAFHAAAGIFLFVYYSRGAGGFPWYLANSAKIPVWNSSLILIGLVCWLVVCSLLVVLGMRLRAVSLTNTKGTPLCS
jgi:hypothetical protein